MIKTFVFKLYHVTRNRCLHRQINAAGLTWNHCVVPHKRYYRMYGKSLNQNKLKNHLTKLKTRPHFSYLLEYGSQAVQVPWNLASSQLCHVYGYKDPETKDLSVRRWTCPQCHTEHDRDRNAAINIESFCAESPDAARTEVLISEA